MPPVFKSTFLCPARLLNKLINSVIVWYEMLWTFQKQYPFFHLLLDSGSDETFFAYRWDPADFHFHYFMWLQHLSYFADKNVVVTSPFWVWGPLGLASMQLPVFSSTGVLQQKTLDLILRRHLKHSTPKVKEIAYKTIVRPQKELCVGSLRKRRCGNPRESAA